MSNKGLGLRQTKGKFQIMGKVTGVEKDGFIKKVSHQTLVRVGVELILA